MEPRQIKVVVCGIQRSDVCCWKPHKTDMLASLQVGYMAMNTASQETWQWVLHWLADTTPHHATCENQSTLQLMLLRFCYKSHSVSYHTGVSQLKPPIAERCNSWMVQRWQRLSNPSIYLCDKRCFLHPLPFLNIDLLCFSNHATI